MRTVVWCVHNVHALKRARGCVCVELEMRECVRVCILPSLYTQIYIFNLKRENKKILFFHLFIAYKNVISVSVSKHPFGSTWISFSLRYLHIATDTQHNKIQHMHTRTPIIITRRRRNHSHAHEIIQSVVATHKIVHVWWGGAYYQ